MLANTTLPHGPLYDPKSKIRNWKYGENFDNIRLNLLGKGVYTDPTFYYFLGNDKEWRRPKEICNRPYFIREKPDRFDVGQGYLGNCWLLSSMALLPSHDELIKHVVPPDQNFDNLYIGAFHFRIWQLGTWYDVVVDDRLPVFKENKELCFGRSRSGDVFWAALLEKAYAKVCGTTYDILEDGTLLTSLQDFSGGIVEMVPTRKPPKGTTLKWFLKEVLSNNALIGCICYDDSVIGVPILRPDLVGQHGYCITSIFSCPDNDPIYPGIYLIRLLDVAGNSEWEGEWSDESRRWREIDRKIRKKLGFVVREDGEFWMDDTDFATYFSDLYVCHLGPGQYEESRRIETFRTWRTISFNGEWVKNVSAGGKIFLHLNPQYMIELRWPENDLNRDMLSNVVIELTHRTRYNRLNTPDIGYFIYSLEDVHNPTVPFDQYFFLTRLALNEYKVDMVLSDGRAYLSRMELKPGKYCIVPFTKDKDIESQFLLRVYAESRVEMWEYDTQTSKSLPIEKEVIKIDERLEKLFYDVADDKGEIDWIGLQNILNRSITADRSYFIIIASVFKFIWEFLDSFISIPFCGMFETGEAVFTKDDCRSMIAMLDEDRSGKLSFSEFSNLWNKICFWTEVFKHHSDDTGKWMETSQLRDAVSSIGFNINRKIQHILIHRYANDKEQISLEDFILCGVFMETGMSLYEKKNVPDKNEIMFSLEEWVENVLLL